MLRMREIFLLVGLVFKVSGFKKGALPSLAFPSAFKVTAIQRRPNFLRMNSGDSMKEELRVDVAVLGGGPAGTTISWLLAEREDCSVALIDPKVNTMGSWYPNYGEWKEEWKCLSERLALPELLDCTTTEWADTECFFGGSYDKPDAERTLLNRAYVRVDRVKLQRLMRERFQRAKGVSIASKLTASRTSLNVFDKDLVHDGEGSHLTLANGQKVHCKLLIDATGLESRLISKESPMLARGVDKELTTGFQIAYGFIAHVSSLGPYNPAAMTLFDYRTDHFKAGSDRLKGVSDKPTVRGKMRYL